MEDIITEIINYRNHIQELIHKAEYFGQSDEFTDDETTNFAKIRIIMSAIKESSESIIKIIDDELKNRVNETSVWKNKDIGKLLELSFKKTSVINPKIVDELTDEECRKGYTVTAKAITLSGRKDLLDKYKTITESKTITLREIKD